jgi:hypothetical protein
MLKPCDIILTRSRGLWGRSILRFMKFFQKDPVHYNHSVLFIGGLQAIEVESKIRVMNIYRAINKAEGFKIIRYKKLTEKQSGSIIKATLKLKGLQYGVGRLLLQIIDHLFNTNFFTKLKKDRKCQVCSSLIAWAYWTRCRLKFNDVNWKSVDPDDIDDECKRNPQDWKVLKEQ